MGCARGCKYPISKEREIIADYAELQSIKATAERHGVSLSTVSEIIKRNPESQQIIEDVRRQGAERLREYIAEQAPRVEGIISALIDKIGDPETIKKANLLQSATTLGIVLDKFAPNVQQCGPVAIQINFGGNPANSGDDFG